MEFQLKNDPIEKENVGCIIIGVYAERMLTPSASALDKASGGALSQILERGDLEGHLGQTLLLHDVSGVTSPRVLCVGCGAKDALNARHFQTVLTKTMATLAQTNSVDALSCLSELEVSDLDMPQKMRLSTQLMALSTYRFDAFKSAPESPKNIDQVFLLSDKVDAELELAVRQGDAVAQGMCLSRDIANMPPNICNPAYLAEQARTLATQFDNLTTEVIDEKQMTELGMNSYLAVARGSENEPMMSLMHYQGASNPQAKPIVLVGKGLTFDAGGISLKPGDGMDEMKYDMCGAASVFGVMKAVALLKLPLNVIGVVAGAENMPDGKAYRPGDILTSMSGRTIEVLNTDAEGRLVLCDALTYVERFSPAAVIDIATLTGACVIALGHHISGLVSDDETLVTQLLEAGIEAQDQAWRLPLTQDYQDQIDSTCAEIANIGGRPAGTITAAAFLSRFTANYPWAHFDIAGTAWKSGKEKGATGRPVALLSHFLMRRAH